MSTETIEQPEANRNSPAVASLVLGALAFVFAPTALCPGVISALSCVGGVAALLAFTAGVKGIREARKNDGQGRNLAITGIAVGGLGLVLVIVLTIPSFLGPQRRMAQAMATGEAAQAGSASAAADAYFNQGIANAEAGDIDQAIRDFTKVIELAPNDAAAYYNRGIAYKRASEPDLAIADYTKTIELAPNFAKAYNSRGNAYNTSGDLKKAIADYTKCIELDPDFALAYNNRGFAYQNTGDLEQAIADFDKAIELDPDFSGAYFNRGLVYRNAGDLEQALADYTKAIELDSEYVKAYNNRGLAHLYTGDRH
jgi:tetratricopeptide (TPR) repeat protein